jgi:hypothetical protein
MLLPLDSLAKSLPLAVSTQTQQATPSHSLVVEYLQDTHAYHGIGQARRGICEHTP